MPDDDEIYVHAHKRRKPVVEITFTCEICGETYTISRYPGRTPKICDKEECQREAKRRINQTYYERKKGGKE